MRLEAQLAESTNPLTSSTQALQNYRLALSDSQKALDKYGDSLKKDKLYGTALILNALCQWRIAELDANADAEAIKKVVAATETLAKDQKIKLGTRDQVLLKALPGFREHTLAQREKDPARAKELYTSSLQTLDKALSDVSPPEDHPIRVYVRLFQMRTVRAWRWAEFPTRPEEPVDRKKWLKEFNARYVGYRNHLGPLLASNDALYKQVRELDKDFGVKSDPRKG